MPHLSASRVLFEEGLYSDVAVTLQVPRSLKKTLRLHSRILTKESELFANLLAKKNVTEKAIILLDKVDSNGSQVVEIQCTDALELYALESSLRLLYTGSWCSDRDFRTNSLDARIRRGMDVMKQAARLNLKGTTTALLQDEITQMCQTQPELMEKLSRSLRSEDGDDDQAILKFDKDALQQMCKIAVVKSEIRDHCELVIARNLYGPKKFRDFRMTEVRISELRPGYIFPPGGQESIYLLKGAPSLPLHPCRASNVEALRQVVDHYTAYNSQEPLRRREYYVIPSESEDVTTRKSDVLDVTFYRITFRSGYRWLLDQVIKVRAPFELIILLLKDAVDENADSRSNVFFGEFATNGDGDIYLQGVNYIADGLLHAFQDPSLESFRNPGTSGSLLNMISYGVSSLTDLPPLRVKPKGRSRDAGATHRHQEYPALPTLVMEFFWEVLQLALKRPRHLEFIQLLLDSITKIAPLVPFEVIDRIEERLAELLEETRKKIMEQRGVTQGLGEDTDEIDENDKENGPAADKSEKYEKPEEPVRPRTISGGAHGDTSSGRIDDFDERTSMISSVLLTSEVSYITKTAPIISTKDDDASSLQQDEEEEEEEEEEEAETEAEAGTETPWMRPEYLQPLCLQLLTKFKMNIQSSLLWAIHDLQLL
ncbi:hypothetical protein BGZ65_012805 [Modicella reniformis]|uniref:BTB domain-containing protein n=1 Tax=Modicella reniformis TaxID=1440133 RepID=A0A9P6M2D7_9FUNG|nr:hypothetical protein BGZ65_012805 [Modicella reniformis]